VPIKAREKGGCPVKKQGKKGDLRSGGKKKEAPNETLVPQKKMEEKRREVTRKEGAVLMRLKDILHGEQLHLKQPFLLKGERGEKTWQLLYAGSEVLRGKHRARGKKERRRLFVVAQEKREKESLLPQISKVKKGRVNVFPRKLAAWEAEENRDK